MIDALTSPRPIPGGPLSATQALMLRGIGVFVAVLLIVTTVRAVAARSQAQPTATDYTGTAVFRELSDLRTTLDRTTGELEVLQLELARSKALIDLSSRYQVPADLAGLIYDTALREGIDPELAFRLVNVESNFEVRARSSVGAIGLAQVMVNTARFYQPGITVKGLYHPATNLTIGFRYLHDLLGTYQGNLRLALLAYNRGPAKVNELLGVGQDPNNGYEKSVMRGYKPSNHLP